MNKNAPSGTALIGALRMVVPALTMTLSIVVAAEDNCSDTAFDTTHTS